MLFCSTCKNLLLNEATRYSCPNCGKTFSDREGIIQFARDTLHIYVEHKRRYSIHELREKIESNGFQIKKMSNFMPLLYPFILLSQKFSFRTKSTSNEDMKKPITKEVMCELEPNVVINSLFFLIFILEMPIISSTTLPFGSSLLCGAVKGVVIS